jgi:hypothetical protein
MPTLLMIIKHLPTKYIRFFANTVETLLFSKVADIKSYFLILSSITHTKVIPLKMSTAVCIWSHV